MPEDFPDFFVPASPEHVRREKAKARELRESQWWKNRRGNGVCYYCKRRFPPRELTMDHIVPVIRGGFSNHANIVPCCKECNSKKSYLLPVEWQEYLETLNGTTPPQQTATPPDRGTAAPASTDTPPQP